MKSRTMVLGLIMKRSSGAIMRFSMITKFTINMRYWVNTKLADIKKRHFPGAISVLILCLVLQPLSWAYAETLLISPVTPPLPGAQELSFSFSQDVSLLRANAFTSCECLVQEALWDQHVLRLRLARSLTMDEQLRVLLDGVTDSGESFSLDHSFEVTHYGALSEMLTALWNQIERLSPSSESDLATIVETFPLDTLLSCLPPLHFEDDALSLQIGDVPTKWDVSVLDESGAAYGCPYDPESSLYIQQDVLDRKPTHAACLQISMRRASHDHYLCLIADYTTDPSPTLLSLDLFSAPETVAPLFHWTMDFSSSPSRHHLLFHRPDRSVLEYFCANEVRAD